MSTVPPPDDRVTAYLDGELDTVARREVEGLLATSDDWRAALAAQAEVRDAVRGLARREAPPGFWEELLARPEPAVGAVAPAAAPGARPAPAAVTPLRRRAARWAPAVAAVAAAAVAALVVPKATVEPRQRRSPQEFRFDDDDERIGPAPPTTEPERDDDSLVDDVLDALLGPFDW